MPTKILKIVKDDVFNEGIQLICPNDHVNPFDPIFWQAKLLRMLCLMKEFN
jgi:hypothetical protein